MHDELRAYRKQDFMIGKWRVHQPTLGDVEELGEELYWSIVCSFVGTAYDERLYLWSKGIDFNSMTDFQVFVMRIEEGAIYPIDLFFPDIHIQNYHTFYDPETENILLIDDQNKIVITEDDYTTLTDFLRSLHGLPKNSIKDGNEATKKWRLDYELRQIEKKIQRGIVDEFHSILQPCVSALTNMAGFKYSWHTVWDLPIGVFYDALRRTQAIKISEQLMTGLYSGSIDYKTMKHKDDLNWLRALNNQNT